MRALRIDQQGCLAASVPFAMPALDTDTPTSGMAPRFWVTFQPEADPQPEGAAAARCFIGAAARSIYLKPDSVSLTSG